MANLSTLKWSFLRIASRRAGYPQALCFHTVCAVNAQTWLNCNQNGTAISPALRRVFSILANKIEQKKTGSIHVSSYTFAACPVYSLLKRYDVSQVPNPAYCVIYNS